jgi:hypothetical protein
MAIRKIVTRSVQDNTLLAVDMNAGAFGNSSMPLPIGTTAERPNPPAAEAHVRYNTTLAEAEIYKDSQWGALTDVGYHALIINDETGFIEHEVFSSTSGNVAMTDLENSHTSFFAKSSTFFEIDSFGNLTVIY